MSRRWRWILVAVTALAVLGGVMPRALRAGAEIPTATTAFLVSEATFLPINCQDATCGKSSPVPAAPPLTIAALDAALAGVIAFATARVVRRLRHGVDALPRGTARSLFRPPQLSSFDLHLGALV
jgi:hypothetical protein